MIRRHYAPIASSQNPRAKPAGAPEDDAVVMRIALSHAGAPVFKWTTRDLHLPSPLAANSIVRNSCGIEWRTKLITGCAASRPRQCLRRQIERGAGHPAHGQAAERNVGHVGAGYAGGLKRRVDKAAAITIYQFKDKRKTVMDVIRL